MRALTGAVALAGLAVAASGCGTLHTTTYHEDHG
jgi:hypothetical protein